VPTLAFLGGHPRSGTTLLEQILGAHPGITALDECPAFTTVTAAMFSTSAQLTVARLNVMRRIYLEAIQREARTSLPEKLVLDKNPTPTLKLRMWLRMFPELRVVIALRDPRDVVISCYFQNIPLNPFNANFLTLERTAVHYANLMDIWLAVRKWEGLPWIESRYEDVVSDLENEGRRVTEFLGLPWHEDQAAFHVKSAAKTIHSPTYHEASRPLYKHSVARWHAYAKHLDPVHRALDPYCKAFGYS
jgi:hypothetical protein